jgi:hypothetical protein
MSFSFGKKENTQTTAQKSQTDPWEPVIPHLEHFLAGLKGVGEADSGGATESQKTAHQMLIDQGLGGTPHGAEIDKLAGDLLGTKSRAGELDDPLADLKRRLTPTADGENRDILANPFMEQMLTRVGDGASQSVNSMFAKAGRDLSGYNQRALGEGIATAQTPLLFNQYNLEQGRTDAAGRDLFAAETGTVTTKDMLDRMASGQRTSGVDVARNKAEMDAMGPQMVLELEEMMKGLPYEKYKRMAELLFPMAGFGQQGEGTSTTKGKQSGWGVSASAKDIMSLPGMK